MYGGLGGSLLGGTLGGVTARSFDKDKTSSAKEPEMSTPFTEYLQAKTAGFPYLSPVMIPAGIGALTGGLAAGPDHRLLGAGAGGLMGMAGGALGRRAGGYIGGKEQPAIDAKMLELGAKPVEGLSNLADYARMTGQMAGAGAGGYLGGRLVGGNDENA
jgi:hypothetical protein